MARTVAAEGMGVGQQRRAVGNGLPDLDRLACALVGRHDHQVDGVIERLDLIHRAHELDAAGAPEPRQAGADGARHHHLDRRHVVDEPGQSLVQEPGDVHPVDVVGRADQPQPQIAVGRRRPQARPGRLRMRKGHHRPVGQGLEIPLLRLGDRQAQLGPRQSHRLLLGGGVEELRLDAQGAQHLPPVAEPVVRVEHLQAGGRRELQGPAEEGIVDDEGVRTRSGEIPVQEPLKRRIPPLVDRMVGAAGGGVDGAARRDHVDVPVQPHLFQGAPRDPLPPFVVDGIEDQGHLKPARLQPGAQAPDALAVAEGQRRRRNRRQHRHAVAAERADWLSHRRDGSPAGSAWSARRSHAPAARRARGRRSPGTGLAASGVSGAAR